MGWGDEIMVSGRVRVLRERHPQRAKVRVIDRYGRHRWHEMWDGNPNIFQVSEHQAVFQDLLDGPGHRPYHTKKTDERWTYNLDFRPDVGDIFFRQSEVDFAKAFKPDIVIGPTLKKKASPNKQWGEQRWQEFVRLAIRDGFRVAQLGPSDTQVYDGVELMVTGTFRHACAVLARARAYVGHEGGLHHAAAALQVPGVVIFGGFTPVELTGYAIHRNLGASLDEACGMRIPCEHCAAVMAGIEPERVLEELKGAIRP